MNKEKLEKSILDDSADIYKPREEKSEKEKLKEMTPKEKWVYFNHYYRNKLIAFIGIAAFVIYLGYSIFAPKPVNKLYVAIINGSVNQESVELLRKDFADYIQLDAKTETLTIDNSFYLGTNGLGEYSYANEQKLSTYIFAGEIDIIIAPEKDMENYAKLGTLIKITDQLPTNMVTKFADNFFYGAEVDDDVIGPTFPYGIYLDDTVVYDNSDKIMEKPVLGIVANSQNDETAIDFIRYIFQLD